MQDGIAAATASRSTSDAAEIAIELRAEIMADRQGKLTAAEGRKAGELTLPTRACRTDEPGVAGHGAAVIAGHW